MSKRAAEPSDSPGQLKNHSREAAHDSSSSTTNHPAEMGEFEDQYEDEFESDDEIIEAGADGEPDNSDDEQDANGDHKMQLDNDDDNKGGKEEVYIPSRRTLGKDEILEPDPTAYHLLHNVSVPWPCLSFDILADQLGDERRGYPATTYLVTGTQADQAKKNELLVLKLSGMGRMHHDDLDESDNEKDAEDDDEDEDSDPILESRSIPLPNTTNRLRASPHAATTGEHLVASMNETGEVFVHNVTPHLTSFDTPGFSIPPAANKPVTTIRAHGRIEGFAIDWSPLIQSGALLTGDGQGRIFHSSRTESGQWKSDGSAFLGHTSSIEEIQWSPSQNNIFASGSADGTVKIWDLRAKKHKPQLSVDVSSSDINVMSWNRRVDYLLATGADDGVWGVWDLRNFASASTSNNASVASFTFHQKPITSIEFHPTEDSIVCVAAADDTVTLWDLAVELDDEESRDTGGVEDVPPQLLFVHYMKEVKEVHWHRQMPGVVVGTGGEGLGVFRTISV